VEPNDKLKKELFQTIKVIAMVGLSPNEEKPSNVVAKYLKNAGYRVIPVNPQYGEILGEKSFQRLSEIPEKIDVVDVFMKAEKVLPVVEEAVGLKPKCVWLQLGIVNEEAKKFVEDHGILFVMDACMKREHERLFGTRE
jgi:uncharacterized protein